MTQIAAAVSEELRAREAGKGFSHIQKAALYLGYGAILGVSAAMAWDRSFVQEDRAAVQTAMVQFTGEAAVKAIQVDLAFERLGTPIVSEAHEQVMDKLEALAARGLMTQVISAEYVAEAEAKAKVEVARGAWDPEAFQAWSASVANFEDSLTSQVNRARDAFAEAGAIGLEGDRASWHLAAAEVERISGGGPRVPLADVVLATDTAFMAEDHDPGVLDRAREVAAEFRDGAFRLILEVESESAILELREDLADAPSLAM